MKKECVQLHCSFQSSDSVFDLQYFYFWLICLPVGLVVSFLWLFEGERGKSRQSPPLLTYSSGCQNRQGWSMLSPGTTSVTSHIVGSTLTIDSASAAFLGPLEGSWVIITAAGTHLSARILVASFESGSLTHCATMLISLLVTAEHYIDIIFFWSIHP